jgi:hypothetical protein
MIKKIEKENFRQVQLVGMNESLMLTTTYPDEDLDYLCKKCLDLYGMVKSDK